MARPPLCRESGSVPMAPPVEYDWDDWDFGAYFHYAEVPELDRLKGLTGHANIALAIAVGEWIEARSSAAWAWIATSATIWISPGPRCWTGRLLPGSTWTSPTGGARSEAATACHGYHQRGLLRIL